MFNFENRRSLLLFIVFAVVGSAAYFLFASMTMGVLPENETALTDIGEVFGEIGLWLLGIVYGRTLLKVLMRKGMLARSLVPEYSPPQGLTQLGNKPLAWLNRTHNYLGMAAVTAIIIHAVMVGFPIHILFFPAILALLVWQALFGMFLAWRQSTQKVKKVSYAAHAQIASGVLIGVFAGFGHMLVD